MSLTELTCVLVHHDEDLVAARRRAAQIAELLGFDSQDQTRLATAVSEISRNALRYAGGGEVAFLFDREAQPQGLVIRATDHGPGIPHLDEVLAGRYQSQTGLGAGILGAKRLVDTFFIETTKGRGTSVHMRKALAPRQPPVTADRVAEIRRALADGVGDGLAEEFQRQNQELLRALGDLQARQDELLRLQSRFHFNMTHEFRTPVISIIGLCDLLSRKRGQQNVPVEAEIVYIRESAEHLSSLVDDLLDLAKMDAGKCRVRPADVVVSELFGTLRGTLKPLLQNQGVALVFEDSGTVPPIITDATKISQILRNLIANALKFTDSGEIRVGVRAQEDGETIEFTVSDTGAGIAAADQERIFEEFLQLDQQQPRARGTGLGLPLSRRLAQLLGGTLTVRSQFGIGSTFSLRLPRVFAGPAGGDDDESLTMPRQLS